jgi:hypothetical protein
MSEPSSRELNEKIAEIREWLVRIDTKVDMFHDVKRVAEDADNKADKALSLAQENRELIKGMKENTKWLWGCGIAVVAAVIPIGIAVFS